MRMKIQEIDERTAVFIDNLSKFHEFNDGFPEKRTILLAEDITKRNRVSEFKPYQHLLLDGDDVGGYTAAA